MGPIGKELSAKENAKPAPSIKTFMNVFRPLREWIHQTRQPKISTPISAPILRSSSANGHLRHHTNNSLRNLNNYTNADHTNASSNSYGGDSLTGSSGDMLSTANPTPTQQPHHSTLQHRFTPISNTHNGTMGDRGGGSDGDGMLNSLEEQLSGSVRLNGTNEISGMGSTLEMNQQQQFNRSSQARMSLPIMQQNKLRRQAYSHLQRRGPQQITGSMGHIYLQHKGETKQANLPNELTTVDTIRALFVCAFPHMLTMEYMSQPHVKIYIYNPSCNIFYELCGVEDVRHESVLRIHHSDPMAPMRMTSQLSMASLGGLPMAPMTPMAQNQHSLYSTLHRVPARLPPQMMPLSAPQHQQQQQLPQRKQNQTQNQGQHQRPVQPAAPAGMGPAAMMPQHMMGPQAMMALQQLSHPQLYSQQPQLYHHQQQQQPYPHQLLSNSAAMPQLAQIPPPKPRRMIPASYSMHRLQAHPSQ